MAANLKVVSVRLDLEHQYYSDAVVDSSTAVYHAVAKDLLSVDNDVMAVANIDNTGHIISLNVSTIKSFQKNMPEIFRSSILASATCTMLISNTKDPVADEVVKMTRYWSAICSQFDMRCLDHVFCKDGVNEDFGSYLASDIKMERRYDSSGKIQFPFEDPAVTRANPAAGYTSRIKLAEEKDLPSALQKDEAVNLVAKEISGYDREAAYAICLDAEGMVQNVSMVSLGSVSGTMLSPREFFKVPLLSEANSVIVMHNHTSIPPDGMIRPSDEDIRTTEKLCNAGKIIGIEVKDHVIAQLGKTYSLTESGEMPVPKVSFAESRAGKDEDQQPVFDIAKSQTKNAGYERKLEIAETKERDL